MTARRWLAIGRCLPWINAKTLGDAISVSRLPPPAVVVGLLTSGGYPFSDLLFLRGEDAQNAWVDQRYFPNLTSDRILFLDSRSQTFPTTVYRDASQIHLQ
jgi:hypothetical protein